MAKLKKNLLKLLFASSLVVGSAFYPGTIAQAAHNSQPLHHVILRTYTRIIAGQKVTTYVHAMYTADGMQAYNWESYYP